MIYIFCSFFLNKIKTSNENKLIEFELNKIAYKFGSKNK